jgi:DNA-binding MarR family transcriptional regulator
MPATETNLSESLLSATRRFWRASLSNSKAISQSELTRSECWLLWQLHHWDEPKGARPSELARKQGVTAGSVAQQLRSLEDQELVVRVHDKADRRVVLVSLTAKGKKKLKQIRNEFVDEFSQLISFLGARESKIFIRLLLSASEHLENKGTG